VAIKKQTRQQSDIEHYLLRELSVLKNVQHSSIMGYVGAWNQMDGENGGENAVYIVTEYCQGGDLLNLILSTHPLGWRFRIRVALELTSALLHLHDKNIIHRDIKSSNILLDHNFTCKITDFGMARVIPGNKSEPRRWRDIHTNDRNIFNRFICHGQHDYMWNKRIHGSGELHAQIFFRILI